MHIYQVRKIGVLVKLISRDQELLIIFSVLLCIIVTRPTI